MPKKTLADPKKKDLISKEAQLEVKRKYEEIISAFDISDDLMERLRSCNVKSPYSYQDKLDAVATYWITGSIKKTSNIINIPASTISDWKNKTSWWPELVKQANTIMDDVIVTRFTSIIMTASTLLSDSLTNGVVVTDKNGLPVHKYKTTIEIVDGKEIEKIEVLDELETRPMRPQELTNALGVVFDKRALLRGDPTAKVEHVSQQQFLKQVKQKFLDMTREEQSGPKLIEGDVITEE